MDKEKQSLMECLAWCSLKELPKEDDGKDIYIAAVIKVLKADTTVGYAAVKRDADGTDKIIKDFGSCAVIRKVLGKYPYKYLNAEYMPKLKDFTRKSMVNYLARTMQKTAEEFDGNTDKELFNVIVARAMEKQLKKDNIYGGKRD